LHEPSEGNSEVAAFGGQSVLEPIAPLAIADALEDPFFNEPTESIGQDVPGNSEALLEFVKGARASKRVAATPVRRGGRRDAYYVQRSRGSTR